MLNLILLVLGFVALIIGADKLVDGASSFAKRFNVPNIVIGLTIVAFGTSAPELVVNLFASVSHSSDMALGNVIGSNIFNVLFILGVSALIRPLVVRSTTTWVEIPLAMLASAVVFILAGDILFNQSLSSSISKSDGIILLLFFAIFLAYNFSVIKNKNNLTDEVETRLFSANKSVLFILLGLILLVAGGRAVVYSATNLARIVGISEKIIALTIVSIGTSLPELATSIVATRKNQLDIAIGNVVGSNIFNIFFILGISAVIYPVSIQQPLPLEIYVNILSSFLLFAFVFIGRGRRISRLEGLVFLIIYVVFVSILIFMK